MKKQEVMYTSEKVLEAVKNLSDKHQAFFRHYIVSGDPQAAALAAGYSEKTIKVLAYKVLNHPDMQAALNVYREERTKTSMYDAEWKRMQLVKVHLRCMQEEAVLDSEGCPTGEFRFDAANAIRSIEQLNKMDGDLKPTEVTVSADHALMDILRQIDGASVGVK